MKKVLIITYDMIPCTSSWGACQRMYYFAEYLYEKEYDVDIFSCKKNIVDDYGNPIHFRNHQIEVENKFLSHFINSRVRGEKANEDLKEEKTLELFAKARRFIKNNTLLMKGIVTIDKFLYNEPTTLGGAISSAWVSENIEKIIIYIKRNNINVVIISVPAFGMLSAGKLIKQAFGNRVKLIYDYRDPWNLWKNVGRYCFTREKRALSFADEIVCTTESLCKDMSVAFKIKGNRFHTISNGYSNKKWKEFEGYLRKETKTFTISYVGQIELIYQGIRNIQNVIEAYRRLGKNNTLLRIVGVNDVTLENVARLKEEFGERIEILSPVDAKISYQYMLESDVLLLLHTTDDDSGKYIVSGKFYDYAKAGKCILSVDNGKGNHTELINKYGLGKSVRNETKSIFKALSVLYKEWQSGEIKKYSNCDETFSREYQYKHFEELLSPK